MSQVTSTSQGVRITWLPAQPGTYAIGSYVIERSRQHAPFQSVGRVEKDSLAYIDADGQAGDRYRIITEDNQKPVHRSTSETIAASPSSPGNMVLLAAAVPASKVLGSSTQQTPAPDVPAENLQLLLAEVISRLDTAADGQNIDAMGRILSDVQYYQQQILASFSQMTPAQKTTTASVCRQHLSVIDTAIRLLPEQYQLDGLLAKAGCNAIVDNTL